MTLPYEIGAFKCTIPGFTAKAKTEQMSPENIISKLRGLNPVQVQKALDYISRHSKDNRRYVPHLKRLLSTTKNPCILHKILEILEGICIPLNTTKDGVFKIRGSSMPLPNGAVLQSGTVSFKNGVWFVAKGDKAVINGVQIITEDSGIQWRVDLFFDGKEHRASERYVSFDISQKIVVIGSKARDNNTVVSFLNSNPFIPIDPNDDVRIEAKGAVMTVKSRKINGLIPKITIKAMNGEGVATINNGWIQAGIAAKGIVSLSLGRGGHHNLSSQSATTAPFEVVLLDGVGNPKKLKGYKPRLDTNSSEKVILDGYHLIFNNYTQVGILPLGSTARKTHIKGFVPFKVDMSLAANTKRYTTNDFHVLYPKIKLSGHIDATNVKLSIDYLRSLPSKVRKSIRGVDFPTKWKSYGDAYATGDGVIHMKRNTFDMPFLMTSEKAANIIYESLQKEKYEITFPLPMMILFKVLRILPRSIYFWMVKIITKS